MSPHWDVGECIANQKATQKGRNFFFKIVVDSNISMWSSKDCSLSMHVIVSRWIEVSDLNPYTYPQLDLKFLVRNVAKALRTLEFARWQCGYYTKDFER